MNLRGRQAGLEGEAADLSAKYTSKHPEMRNIRAQISDINGKIEAEIDRIVFEDGQCVEATGIVSTALLARLGPRYDLELPQIEGALGCAGDGVGLGYQGRSPVLEVTGSLRLGPDGYRWTSEAHTGEPGVIAVLLALGFEETGAAWRAEGEGRYR